MSGNVQEQLKQIAIGQIAESPTNPRKSFAGMEDLKASIAENGIRVPLLVRPISDPDSDAETSFEVVAGARRFRAAKLLDLKSLPCVVRPMDDAEAYQVQVIENLQRADIHPLEEADAFEELRGRLGTIAAVAHAVSKEQAYVAKCLQLRSLTEMSRKALLGGLIAIEHALLLARLAAREQDGMLKWTLDRHAGSKTPVEKVVEERLGQVAADAKKGGGQGFRYVGFEPASVKQLKVEIEREGGIDLKRAPWKLEDANLVPAAGPCSSCEKNTKANTPLFGDLAIEESRCTDGACYGDKTQAFVRIQMRLTPDTGTPVRLSWKASSVKPSIVPSDIAGGAAETANPQRVLRYGQWLDVKKSSCANVRQGITTDWSDAGQRGYMGSREKLRKPGEAVLVCIAAGCKVHPKGWEKAKASGGGGNSQADYDRQRKEREEKERAYVAAELPVRKAVYAAIKQKAAGKLNAEDLLRSGFGRVRGAAAVCELAGVPFKESGSDWQSDQNAAKPLAEALAKRKGAELLSLIFDILNADELTVNAHMYSSRKRDRESLWKLAVRHKVDADAIARQLEPAAPAKVKKPEKAPAKPAAKKATKKAAKKAGRK